MVVKRWKRYSKNKMTSSLNDHFTSSEHYCPVEVHGFLMYGRGRPKAKFLAEAEAEAKAEGTNYDRMHRNQSQNINIFSHS